jgi:hypothetical protein
MAGARDLFNLRADGSMAWKPWKLQAALPVRA